MINMSKHFIQNKEFLHLILHSTNDQAVALIDTVTPEQIQLLSEIAYNILQLPLPKKGKYLVNSKLMLFKRLADKKTSKDKKKRLLHKNAKHILLTLWAIRPQLQQLQ